MISTHVLDTQLGQPAQNITVTLFKKNGQEWQVLKSDKTNTDGRINFNNEAIAAEYKLEFEIADYFKTSQTDYFFTQAPIIFQINDINRGYHVPILLNSFGYTTYRGS